MTDKKQKYVLTRAIHGAKPQPVGSGVELTEAQARSPLFRNRARLADLTVAIVPAEKEPAEKEPAEKEPAEKEPAEKEPAEKEPAKKQATDSKVGGKK